MGLVTMGRQTTTMRTVTINLLIAAAIGVVPIKSWKNYRTYDPVEAEDRYRIEYPALEDEVYNYSLRNYYPNVEAVPTDVLFYLYTKANPENGHLIHATNFEEVVNSTFDPTKKSLFISHGWRNNYQSEVNTYIRPAVLKAADINVFVVDWSAISETPLYATAKSAVPSVGKIEATFIIYLIDAYKLSPKDFYLVGHSLGAHLAGCAGAAVQAARGSVASIVGLDPAGPLYLLSDKDIMIDSSDADAVHIIHTNSLFLGFRSSLGHADFFPNGGALQPGCSMDLMGVCSHSRAYKYYAESVGSFGFESVECDSYDSYINGKCDNNNKSFMGRLEIDLEARGDFYLLTASSEPYNLNKLNAQYFLALLYPFQYTFMISVLNAIKRV